MAKKTTAAAKAETTAPETTTAAKPKTLAEYMKAKGLAPDHPVSFGDLLALGGNQTWG